MDYPPEWEFFPMEDFASATPRNPGALGVEVLAQIRPNGRVLDHFRVTLGGSRILDINVAMANLVSSAAVQTHRLKFQVWPKDLEMRRNMTSTAWKDVPELVAARDAQLEDANEATLTLEDANKVLKDVQLAFRFAIVVAEDERLQLQLQMMPASAATLMGKPAFRG
jgi:hypothetical protein